MLLERMGMIVLDSDESESLGSGRRVVALPVNVMCPDREAGREGARAGNTEVGTPLIWMSMLSQACLGARMHAVRTTMQRPFQDDWR